MIKTTPEAITANLAHYLERIACNDEQYHVYTDPEHIGPTVERVPHDDTGAPVAVMISPRRLAWLESRSAALRQIENGEK